jgi:hypothetical protein
LIRAEQLAAALERLDPRDRELLELSLHRRVPDEALGSYYGCLPAEVARRRASAIEHLADDLSVQRGGDLGAVLRALLEPETWADLRGEAQSAIGEEFARVETAGGEPAAAPVAPPSPDEETPPGRPRDPASVRHLRAAPPATPPTEEPAPPGQEAPEIRVSRSVPEQGPFVEQPLPPGRAERRAASPTNGSSAQPEPVLEMLSSPAHEDTHESERRMAVAAVLAGGLGVVALAALAGLVGAMQFGDDVPGRQGDDGGSDTRHFVPAKEGPLAAPFPTDPKDAACYTTAYVRRPTTLYREPGGRRRMRIAARTEWKSPRVLAVVNEQAGWLGVLAPELRNGESAWIPRSAAELDCVRWSLHVDLSRHLLFVRRDGHTVRRMAVAVGSPAHPTPTGRFAVTDKLEVTDKASPYGCCVLALSGHQTRLPPEWPGGDRLAVHATTDLSSIGRPVSLGCMRTTSAKARWLIHRIPLGAPIFIRT